MSLSVLCAELRNWFETNKIFNDFTIEDGTLSIDGAQNGQYFRIVGSVFNDGVYQYPASELTDETFTGAIWLMAVPQDVIALSTEIDQWVSDYASVVNSPYSSESFGGYSYTKNTNSSSGRSSSWEEVFSKRLNRWRKL